MDLHCQRQPISSVFLGNDREEIKKNKVKNQFYEQAFLGKREIEMKKGRHGLTWRTRRIGRLSEILLKTS
jgi:hypothetical protein